MALAGTDEFMAPELLFTDVYDQRVDTFSFGMVLAELITRRPPGKDGFLERQARNSFEVCLHVLYLGRGS